MPPVVDVDTINAAVLARREFAVAALRRLLAASRDGETATQTAVQALFGELGWKSRTIIRHPNELETVGEFAHPDEVDPSVRTTVVAENADIGNGDDLALLLWAHPDGMPFDGAHGWRHDPFAGVVEDGRMYGWGIADDLSGVATMVGVAAVLGDLPESRPRVVFASTPSKGHASGVLAALSELEHVGAGIYLHPAESGCGLGDLKAVAPGMLRFRLTVSGRRPATNEPNHRLYVADGVDPIDPMTDLLTALRAFATERNKFANQERKMAMMVGTLHCGDSISRMPTRCEATVTFSMPPGEDLYATREKIAAVVSDIAAMHPWLHQHPPVIDWLFGTTGIGIGQEHPHYRAVASAVEAVTHRKPRYYDGHIASEIRQPMLNYGIPCVGLGPRSGSLAQAGSQSDEWLDLEDYVRMISACTLAAFRWAEFREPAL